MTDNVHALQITRIDPPTGDTFLNALEAQIFQLLGENIDHQRESSLHQATGMAMAREIYFWNRRAEMGEEQAYDAGQTINHSRFIANALIVLRKMSVRQRTKLRHPTRSRAEMQMLFDGEHL